MIDDSSFWTLRGSTTRPWSRRGTAEQRTSTKAIWFRPCQDQPFSLCSAVSAVFFTLRAPFMLSGGGLKMGQVIGESTRDGGEPNSEGVTSANLMGAIMHTPLDTGQVGLMENLSREVKALIAGSEPIRNLT